MRATGTWRARRLRPAAALIVLIAAGCRAPGPRAGDAPPPAERLAGLRAVTADDFGVHLRRDAGSAWLLWADGHFTNAATVHPGETFLLRHANGLRRWYRVVGITRERLSLIEVEERPLPRGQAQARRVVYVKPYDLDEPEAEPPTGAGHPGPQ